MTKRAVQAAVAQALQRSVFLRLTDGRALSVGYPDFAAFSPAEPELILWSPDGTFEVIALAEIASSKVGKMNPVTDQTAG